MGQGDRKRTFRPDVRPIYHDSIEAWVHILDSKGNHVDCGWKQLYRYGKRKGVTLNYNNKVYNAQPISSTNYEVILED